MSKGLQTQVKLSGATYTLLAKYLEFSAQPPCLQNVGGRTEEEISLGNSNVVWVVMRLEFTVQ